MVVVDGGERRDMCEKERMRWRTIGGRQKEINNGWKPKGKRELKQGGSKGEMNETRRERRRLMMNESM